MNYQIWRMNEQKLRELILKKKEKEEEEEKKYAEDVERRKNW